MNGRTKMMLAQAAARRGRGNDYGNPRDNEKPNNNYNNSGYNNAGGEMRDRPYYGGRYEQSPGPVNVIVEPMPMRYEGGNMGGGSMGMNMPENNRYTGYNEGGRYVGYNGGNGGNGMEYRGGSYNGQYPPPIYDEYGGGRRIGFDGSSETGGSRKETNSRNIFFGGSSHRKHSGELTKEKAQEWTKKMKNSDGSSGPHWKLEQTNALMEKLGVSLNPIEFYVAANMMYSDYCGVAKKFGLDTPDYYGHMAKAFLEDKDAGPDKLKKYFEEIVGEEEDDD